MLQLVVGCFALLVIFGFVVVRRLRMDGRNWLIVLVGLLLIGGVLLSWSALVRLARPFFGASGPLPVLAFSSSAPAGSSSSILGPPSLSASFIDRVLSASHSPAVGLGHTLVMLSQSSGIDDAYALAFFWQESSFGTAGVARVTHSLGNIRCTAGWSCSAGYRSYPSWQAGARDWFALISTVYVAHGLTTLERILPVYAPPSDNNDVAAYSAAVRSAVSVWRAGRVQV